MSEFTSELRQRVAEAQGSLSEARETGDDYLVQLSLGQIESLARLAAENHVLLDGVEESLALYGLTSASYRSVSASNSRSTSTSSAQSGSPAATVI